MEVYIDLIMLFNFVVDLLLLLGTNRLWRHPTDFRRTVPAALLGAMYVGICLLPGFSFLANIGWRIVFMCLKCWIAFAWQRNFYLRSVCFLILSFALSGFAVLLGKGGGLSVGLVICTLGGLTLLGLSAPTDRKEFATVNIRHKQRKVSITALVDTGNMLKDPVTGCDVLVADARAAYHLLGLAQDELLRPVETISRGKYPGLRLIPYSAIGQPSGMLLGLRTEELQINGKPSQQIVAFAPQKIGFGKGYEALMGGNVC